MVRARFDELVQYAEYATEIAAVTLAPALLGLILGQVIDRVFNLYPAATVTLLILGILTGLWSMYKKVGVK